MRHWRLGHPAPDVPYKMCKMGAGLGVTEVMLGDCSVCDKAKFRKKQHKRQPISVRYNTAPYFRIYVDGFGGQESYGCKSYGGAVGGYVFACTGCAAVDVKLYAQKSQFPRLFVQYLHEVIAKDYMVRIVCCDCAGEMISVKEMEPIMELCGSYQVLARLRKTVLQKMQ